MNRILITGGSGFIGYKLAVNLSKNKNNEITVFDNNFKNLSNKFEKSKNIKFIKGDIRDLYALKKAIKNIDLVIHLAFINGTELFYSHANLVLEVGVLGTMNLIKLINTSKNNVKKFIFFSSSEVYNNAKKIPTTEDVTSIIPDVKNPRFSYASSKLLGEVLTFHLLKKGIKRIVIRPHNVYGPNMGNLHVIPEIILKIKKLFKNKTEKFKINIQGTGNETRAFCYIDDAIEAIKIILTKGKDKQIYNVGSNQEISIKKLIKIIAYLLKIKIKIKPGKIKTGSAKRRCPDITKIKKLGYKAKFSVIAGLKKTIQFYLN